MNDGTLRRARVWTLAVAAGLSLVLGIAVSPRYGVGVLVTAVWATAGFWLIEALARRALVPAGTARPIGAILALAGAKILLYGLAVWVLLARLFPVTSHLVGFSLLLLSLLVVTAASRRRGRSGAATPRGNDA